MMDWGVGSGNGRVEHVERGEGESGGIDGLGDFNAGAQSAQRDLAV